MTRPTARVLALLEILQAGGTRTVADLADRLDVDERTVRRYAGHLLDLDIPIRSVRGRYGGYRLAPGYRLPPLMFTDDEAVAVALGLVAGRLSGLAPGEVSAGESAAAKIRRVLPAGLADRLDALVATVRLDARGPAIEPAATAALLVLAESARDRHAVAFAYTDRHGRRTDRVLHPYGVVARLGRWYVTGEDAASGELRSFRLDRMTGPRALDESFEIPAGFDPVAAVVEGISGAPWRHRVVVRVDATPDEVRSALPRGLPRVVEPDGGRTRVEFRAERLDWVPSVLLRLERPFVVDEPADLRDLLRLQADRLRAAAGALEAPNAPAGDQRPG